MNKIVVVLVLTILMASGMGIANAGPMDSDQLHMHYRVWIDNAKETVCSECISPGHYTHVEVKVEGLDNAFQGQVKSCVVFNEYRTCQSKYRIPGETIYFDFSGYVSQPYNREIPVIEQVPIDFIAE